MLTLDLHKTLRGPEGKLNLHVNLQVPFGETLAIAGPSGAGKTTLLRMIAGLTPPDQGTIHYNHQPWHTPKATTPPQTRRCGLVFQHHALFPNMSVLQNLRFAQSPSTTSPTLIEELLERTALSNFRHSRPDQLSGGQQQRLALARALAAQPLLLLLDEPFSAQDKKLRPQLINLLADLQTRWAPDLITILVTHDLGDIFQLAHRVALLSEGKITAIGIPASVFSQTTPPATAKATILSIQCGPTHCIVLAQLDAQLIHLQINPARAANLKPGDHIQLGISEQ